MEQNQVQLIELRFLTEEKLRCAIKALQILKDFSPQRNFRNCKGYGSCFLRL